MMELDLDFTKIIGRGPS